MISGAREYDAMSAHRWHPGEPVNFVPLNKSGSAVVYPGTTNSLTGERGTR